MPILTSSADNWVCSYGRWSFDPDYTKTLGFRVRPVPDATGRTVMYNEYTIRLRTYIKDGPVSPKVLLARQELSEFGQAFRFKQPGLGNLTINVGSVRDVKYGPCPREVAFRFMGSENVCELEWEVEVHIPDCACAAFAFKEMEFFYSCTFEVADGYTTRRVHGELRIPNNRLRPGSRTVLDSPDDYYEQLIPPLVEGFRREFEPREVSPDRTVLRFGFTDTEMRGPAPPPGIIRADISQRLSSSDAGLLKWVTTLTGNYDIAPGFPHLVAEQHFLSVVADRLLGPVGRDGPVKIPLHYEVTEPNVYDGPKANFSLTVMTTKSSLLDAIRHHGVFNPIPDEDWVAWAASLADSVLSPRGVARLKWSTNEDKILDLCRCGPAPAGGPRPPQPAKGKFAFLFAGLNPAASWLEYEIGVEVQADSGTVEAMPLPQKELKDAKPPELEAEPPPMVPPPSAFPDETTDPTVRDAQRKWRELHLASPNSGLGPVAGVSVTGPKSGKADDGPKVQRRTPAAVAVFLYGRAARLGYPVPIPGLTELEIEGGKKLTLGDGIEVANRRDMGEGYVAEEIGNYGLPVYGAAWRLRYILTKTPKNAILPPYNPMHHADGRSDAGVRVTGRGRSGR